MSSVRLICGTAWNSGKELEAANSELFQNRRYYAACFKLPTAFRTSISQGKCVWVPPIPWTTPPVINSMRLCQGQTLPLCECRQCQTGEVSARSTAKRFRIVVTDGASLGASIVQCSSDGSNLWYWRKKYDALVMVRRVSAIAARSRSKQPQCERAIGQGRVDIYTGTLGKGISAEPWASATKNSRDYRPAAPTQCSLSVLPILLLLPWWLQVSKSWICWEKAMPCMTN